MIPRLIALFLVCIVCFSAFMVQAQTPLLTDSAKSNSTLVQSVDSSSLLLDSVNKQNNATGRLLLNEAQQKYHQYLEISNIGLATFALGVGIPVLNFQGLGTRHPANRRIKEVEFMYNRGYLSFQSKEDALAFKRHIDEARRQNRKANITSLVTAGVAPALAFAGLFMAFSGGFMAKPTLENRILATSGTVIFFGTPLAASLVPPILNRKRMFYARQHTLAAQELLK